MELIMSDWHDEQKKFLEKIGQIAPSTPAPKPTTKKDEE
tara:strand:+ start:1096 stop:1212 length:117 start_codon:yes stop_codon:yes gene_type:complete